MVLFYVITSSFFLMTGCLKISPKSSGVQDEPRLVERARLESPTYSIVTFSSPNSYGLIFKFNPNWPKELLVVQASQGQSKVERKAMINLQNELSWNLNNPGLQSDFEFYDADSTEHELLGKVTLTEPHDFLFSGTMHLANYSPDQKIKIEADRIYFTKNSVLIIDGKDVKLNAREIFFEDAEIRGFKLGQKAEVGTRGRNAGHLTITAQRSEGNLMLTMKGEEGGDGFNGDEPGPSLNGDHGEPGVDGEIGSTEIISTSSAIIGPISLHTLKKQPTAGSPPKAGKQGNPGQNGLQGGNSLRVNFIIAENKDLNFRRDSEVALGGLGGLGGAGGNGGRPGEPGQCIENWKTIKFNPKVQIKNCEMPKSYPKAEQGPRGNSGIAGEPGRNFEICSEKYFEKCVYN